MGDTPAAAIAGTASCIALSIGMCQATVPLIGVSLTIDIPMLTVHHNPVDTRLCQKTRHVGSGNHLPRPKGLLTLEESFLELIRGLHGGDHPEA